MIYLIVLAAISVMVWAEWIMPTVEEIGMSGLLFRWFLGHAIMSDEKTNARWIKPGTKVPSAYKAATSYAGISVLVYVRLEKVR